MKSSSEVEQGATVIITHRVRPDQHRDYENWIEIIGSVCRNYPGHLDSQIIRPIAGLTTTYTIIIRFATCEQLQQWMGSRDRQQLIEQVRPLLADDDRFFVRSGLEFWFTPEGERVKMPIRWKQSLVTWSAIYPLVLVMPMLIRPLLDRLGVPNNAFLTTFFVTGTVVWLMTYVVMPRYTQLIRRWLFR